MVQTKTHREVVPIRRTIPIGGRLGFVKLAFDLFNSLIGNKSILLVPPHSLIIICTSLAHPPHPPTHRPSSPYKWPQTVFLSSRVFRPFSRPSLLCSSSPPLPRHPFHLSLRYALSPRFRICSPPSLFFGKFVLPFALCVCRGIGSRFILMDSDLARSDLKFYFLLFFF